MTAMSPGFKSSESRPLDISWLSGYGLKLCLVPSGLVYLHDVTEDQASRYMGFVVDTGKSNNTYNKKITFLKMLFRVLYNSAKLNINPFAEIQLRKKIQQSRRELTIAEPQRIISTAEGDLKLLLQVGTFTGLRLGDCCTLPRGEIDIAMQVIRRKPRKTATRTQKAFTSGIPSILMHELSFSELLFFQCRKLYAEFAPALSRRLRPPDPFDLASAPY